MKRLTNKKGIFGLDDTFAIGAMVWVVTAAVLLIRAPHHQTALEDRNQSIVQEGEYKPEHKHYRP